jgi:hypothetical protein
MREPADAAITRWIANNSGGDPVQATALASWLERNPVARRGVEAGYDLIRYLGWRLAGTGKVDLLPDGSLPPLGTGGRELVTELMHSLGGGSKRRRTRTSSKQFKRFSEHWVWRASDRWDGPLERPAGTDTELRRTREVRADGKPRTVEQLAADASTSTATAKRARRK